MQLTFISSQVKSLSRARLFATSWIVAWTKLLYPWDFQGMHTGMGCHFLLQGIFPTQGLNPGLSYCRQTLYHLSHQGSLPGLPPKITNISISLWPQAQSQGSRSSNLNLNEDPWIRFPEYSSSDDEAYEPKGQPI